MTDSRWSFVPPAPRGPDVPAFLQRPMRALAEALESADVERITTTARALTFVAGVRVDPGAQSVADISSFDQAEQTFADAVASMDLGLVERVLTESVSQAAVARAIRDEEGTDA